MSVLNEDTIWLADGNGFNGGLIRTTNGGQNWTQQYFDPSGNPDHIYMLNGTEGFMSASRLYKTTNSGLNWNVISLPELGFADRFFIDSLTGWKVRSSSVKKTTDGGLSWTLQTRPSGGMLLSSAFFQFSNVNNDTIWGVRGIIRYGPNNERGIIWRTTNGGLNWGFQIPDTSIHLWSYYYIDFVNKLNGWAYVPIPNTGVHTVTGGNDTTIYLNMTPLSTDIPEGYRLHQCYPNPFNYSTRIKFDISKTSDVKLKVYNLLGKEVDEIVNSKVSPGSYDYKFIGSELSSGVYLYRLVVDNNVIDTKKMVLLK